MHLPPGRAVGVAQIFLAILFVSSASYLVRAQAPSPSPSPQKPLIEVTPARPQPTSPSGQQKPTPDDPLPGVVVTNTDLITFTVTVTDTYGRFVSGLSKNAFTVFDEKKPQEITFFSDDDSPVSVGVIFDVSGSMSGDKVKRARDALSKFIQTSHNSDEYFLIALIPGRNCCSIEPATETRSWTNSPL